MPTKAEIRQAMRAERRALGECERQAASAVVCRRLLERLAGAEVVAAYLASRDEIDLSDAINEWLGRGVKVVAPRWDGATYRLAQLKSLNDADLRQGPMKILEPKGETIVRPREVSAWVVPGLAFTAAGSRLGYGGGWYDRLLVEAAPSALKLGVAYGFQIVEALPTEPHDIKLDAVICG